ncbi:polysaccharide biosynthesis tyrosine autokinase [Nostoc sp. TCL26-01]|uniref:GumC family protein n=1 Tax=Nostoc sp. TCL26-01 TaxID=2576904 RepID=UPI0015B89F4D|nr:polysaccharide biosynthesis tyrosine autokinase [Nostoc sp. TCL26-01]QLE58469.1 polysaccharide biosynthesis tyrosine autokinase [Nostoc sp. TCL26-01]
METTNSTEEIDIQKYLLVLKRRWWIIAGVFVTFATLGGALSSLQPTTYEATGKLLFQTDRTSALTGIDGKIGDLESLGSNPLDTQALLVRSKPIIQEVIKTLNLKDEQGEPLQPEAIEINVASIMGTDGLTVSYVSRDPELAKKIVNQVMKSYIANNILTNRSQAIAAGNFIDKQLPSAKAELEQSQKALLQFKRQNQIINLKEETTGLVKNTLTLDNEINNARVQIAESLAREKQLSSQINLPIKQAVEISSLSQAPGVQEVLAELQKTQTQLKLQQTRYTDANPIITNLKSQEAALKTILKQRITEYLGYPIQVDITNLQVREIKRQVPLELEKLRSQRLSLEKKLKSFSILRDSYNQRILAIPNLEKIQGELEQKLSLAQKNYENLLVKSQEIKIVESQTVGNARILEEAEVGSSPSAGKKKGLVLIVAIFGGLVIGIAVAFLVDIVDRKVKTVKEAEGIFNYTLLGLIPTFQNKNNNTLNSSEPHTIIVETSPRSMIHEAFGMLQANLKFISLDKKIRTIAVTSSTPGEGKSQVAANLAAVMAQTGRRVLLIDADLRRPSQHHLWNLINSTGLSNVVAEQEQLHSTIQSVTPNLSLLTSGVIPPNPLAIIDSEAMRTLLEGLSTEYDYIIIDTPPLLGNADGVVLSKMADGVLVVARIGLVDSTSMTTAKALLSRSEVNVLGMVANAVDVQQEPNYFYYQSQPSEKSVEKVDSTH